MAKYVLLPCKLREDQLVPQKGAEPVTYDWKQLQEALAPSKTKLALLNLSNLRVGQYVGLARRRDKPEELTNFVLGNDDRSGDASWVLKKDPSFEKRLVSVFKVEFAERDAKVEERDTTMVDPFQDPQRKRMVEVGSRR